MAVPVHGHHIRIMYSPADSPMGEYGLFTEDKRKAGLPTGGNPAYQSVGNHVSCHGTQKKGGLPPRDKEE